MSLVLDNRSKDAIYRHLQSLAQYYVPEWNAHFENDLGTALLKIYAEMFAETLARFNKMPYKNFIYFLNLLGAEMLPCLSSEGYLTVTSVRSLHVDKGTRAYSTGADGEKIMYALQDNLTVVDNRIIDVLCTRENIIVSGLAEEIRLFDFFNGVDLQKQGIFLSSENGFNIKEKALISIIVINTDRPFTEDETAHTLYDPRFSRWQCMTDDGWVDIEAIGCVSNRIDLDVNIKIPLTGFNNIMSRWLRCIIDNSAPDVYFTDIHLSACASVRPDSLYNNDLHLQGDSFFPFGERFARFDSFYIGCEEAFTKKSAQISIEFSVEFEKIPSLTEMKHEVNWKPVIPASELNEPEEAHIYIDDVVWEYWNGNGWVRLFVDNTYSDVFRKGARHVITFDCPEDIEITSIGGSESYFIRARVQRHGSLLTFNSCYMSPIIENIVISYQYRNEGVSVDCLFTEKDLSLKSANRIDEVSANGKIEKHPTAYFALERPILSGIFTLYFRNIADLEYRPPVKFEYYGICNSDTGWHELKAVDETKNFSSSGLITFICAGTFEQLELFSINKYWLRVVNTDDSYNNSAISRPAFKGIHFNTVKINQAETKEPEYFYIEPGEVNKICRLSRKNIVNESVWVNELSETPGYELSTYALGKWIKWRRVERMGCAGPEDRVYIMDPIDGIIIFGNGKKGKIPPHGESETIRIEYSVCAGSAGNLEAGKIEGFADSVPFVNDIFNIEPISGGCDAEKVEDAATRCAGIIGHLNRAVSANDFEAIAAADLNTAKVKALITGTGVEIVVLPRLPSAFSFAALKKRIMTELERKAPAVLIYADRVNIVEADYIEFSVRLQVTIEDFRNYSAVYASLEKRLEAFFEPATGNSDARGFEIGMLPTKAQVINYLKGPNIMSIDRLDIFCREYVKGTMKEIDGRKAAQNPRAVPVNGEHEIIITE